MVQHHLRFEIDKAILRTQASSTQSIFTRTADPIEKSHQQMRLRATVCDNATVARVTVSIGYQFGGATVATATKGFVCGVIKAKRGRRCKIKWSRQNGIENQIKRTKKFGQKD